MSLVIDEHREYLADDPRVSAFDAAIRETVQQGDVVLDLASGTGILGLLACRAGARRVYSIEEGSIIGLARDVAAANGFADRMTFIREHSARAQMPERADVLVSDLIGRFGFEAGLIEIVADAQRRLLKPGYRSVPASITYMAAPVEHPAQWDAVRFWSRRIAGLTFEPIQRSAGSTGYPVALAPSQILAAPTALGTRAVADTTTQFSARVDSTIDHDGTLHGIACWFEAQMSPTVTMTNSPLSPRRINRRQAFLPAERAIPVRRGDVMTLSMSILLAEKIVTWSAGIHRGSAAQPLHTFSGSTFNGMLISAEDIARTDPQFVPHLTAAGRGRRTILELCDGRRDLATIEREVFARHPDLFEKPADAAVFVAEVVSGYARPA
jgi:protein arginine N-methyltransferase 1